MGEVEQESMGLIEPPLEHSSEANPWFLGAQKWQKAEKATEKIISIFQPTVVSERKRVAVINYLQRLLKDNLECEVFAYGSVPLRTYLPDGDIDLTAVGACTDDLVEEVASLLESEAKNHSSKFVVKDVQIIRAEVKLVKCLVQNIVVDISINQIGGLCTLCFLEQVDRVIGRDHLFKESIILIKAWCYYESRTLGAHAGLISTYGLETLVLYIFNVFHRSLNGPLSVLYKFLEYFSTFDWDNYCISLIGPVRISDLPKIVVERPPNSHDLLLKGDFLRHCSETLSVPMKNGERFFHKHLNIVDPLKVNNNLGRSVSKGNFVRIRSAFTYGARKLKQILTSQGDDIADELHNFFSNTLNMHGNKDSTGVLGAEKSFHRMETGRPRISNDENSSPEYGYQSFTERKDVFALRLQGLKISDDSHKAPVGVPYHAPHLYFQNSKLRNKNDDGDNLGVHEKVVPCATRHVPKLDLTGDLSSHLACLERVRWWWCTYNSGAPAMAGPPPPPLLLSMIAHEHAHHRGGINGGIRHPVFHPLNQMVMARPPFVPEESYFQEMNRHHHGYQMNGVSNGAVKSPPMLDLPQPPFVVDHGGRTHGLTDADPSTLNPNCFVTRRVPFLEPQKQQNPNQALPAEGIPRPKKPIFGTHRFMVQSSYHLKDDDDFPPLSI